MPILTSGDYPAVRAAIDVSLDTKTLPDAIIDMPQYEPAAEMMVIARDPEAGTRTDPVEVAHVKNAAILYTAGLLAVAVPVLLREQFPEYQYQRQAVDSAALQGILFARASEELDAYLIAADQVDFEERPTMFAAACGWRGW